MRRGVWRGGWRRLRRRPALFWMVAAALSLGTGLMVLRLLDNAAAAAARYGSLTSVPVVVRPVPAGDVLRPGDIAWRQVPRAFLPASAPAKAPIGHAALVPLLVGEVIVDQRLAPTGLRGGAALIPAGDRALAVPLAAGAPTVAPGDHVDVLATIEGSDPPTSVAARSALVVEVREQSATVAVTADEAPAVAFALARGAVTLALVGAP